MAWRRRCRPRSRWHGVGDAGIPEEIAREPLAEPLHVLEVPTVEPVQVEEQLAQPQLHHLACYNH